jgi:hypothetical protein
VKFQAGHGSFASPRRHDANGAKVLRELAVRLGDCFSEHTVERALDVVDRVTG